MQQLKKPRGKNQAKDSFKIMFHNIPQNTQTVKRTQIELHDNRDMSIEN